MIQHSIIEFNQVTLNLTETSYQLEDTKLTVLLEWSLSKVGQVSSENHGHDAAHILKSFHSNSALTSRFKSSISHHYWITLSASEFDSLKNLPFIRNPWVSFDHAPSDQQQHHDLMWFHSWSEALNHCLYLRVVVTSSSQRETQHQVCTTCTQGCSGSRFKGHRSLQVGELMSIWQWHRQKQSSQNSRWMSLSLISWSSQLALRSSKSARQRVSSRSVMCFFHERISLSHLMISDSLWDIVLLPVKLNEKCLSITRESHQNVEHFLLNGKEWSLNVIKRIDWSSSFPVEELQINPFQTTLMDVNGGIIITSEEEQGSTKRPHWSHTQNHHSSSLVVAVICVSTQMWQTSQKIESRSDLGSA